MLGWILGGYNGELTHSNRVFEAREGDKPKVRPLRFCGLGVCCCCSALACGLPVRRLECAGQLILWLAWPRR